MKKLQFFVIYCLNGGNPNNALSTGVDVEVPIDANGMSKSFLILKEIAKNHNNTPDFYKVHGLINFDNIWVINLTRLD
jgi:hypothetical protein